MDAVTGLVSRLEGMLPSVETAGKTAAALGIEWSCRDGSATLAWAGVVWPLYHVGRIGELLAVVAPRIPEGQPFGQSEIDTVHGQLLLAQVEGVRWKGTRRRSPRSGAPPARCALTTSD